MSITKRTIKGITYLIERTSYRDENGRPRTHDKVIGRIDPATGDVMPTRKKKKELPPTETPEIIDTEFTEKTRRTIAKAIAEKDSPLVHCPERLAVPTLPTYEYSISFHQDGKAYLQNLSVSTDGLQFENGKMFFSGALEPISTVELQDMRTNKGIEEIDIPLLTMYYSIILASFQEKIKQGLDVGIANGTITRIYAPDLMRRLETLGEGSGANEKNISIIMEKTRAFHTIVGIHHITRNGRPDKSFFPLMNFEGYDSETNTISFFSPYLSYIIREIYSASIRCDKKGIPRIKRNGQPMLYPSNSFLIKPSIVSERNKAAVENVFIIVQLIEQAGDKGIPHIKAKTLIERNEALMWRLKRDTHPHRLLSRVFKKTWQLLREQTLLLEVYEDIELPDPNDIEQIPTFGNLDHVFNFRHKGKKKNVRA